MKPWYKSKTLWTNALGVAAMLLQSEVGYLLPLEYQAVGLAAVNMLLRTTTNAPIAWKPPGSGVVGVALIVGSLMLAPLITGCSALPDFMLPTAKIANTMLSAQIATMEAAMILPDDDSRADVLAALTYVASQATPDEALSLDEIEVRILSDLAKNPAYDTSLPAVRMFIDQFMISSESYIETQNSLFKKDSVQFTNYLASMINALRQVG